MRVSPILGTLQPWQWSPVANRTPCKNVLNQGDAHSTLLHLPGEAELQGRGLDNDEAKATKGRGNPPVRDSQPKRRHGSSSLVPGGWSGEGSAFTAARSGATARVQLPGEHAARHQHLQSPSCGRGRTSRGLGAVTLVALGTMSPDTLALTHQHPTDLDEAPSTSTMNVGDATGG